MHFVKKVPTTDEEKAIKHKERQMKMKIFCDVRDRLFQKRANGELDDELLKLTQKILEKNPDVYTYWNMRRETIEMKETKWRESSPEKAIENISTLLDNELLLTEICIETNPKSYAAWFQRGWVLKRHPQPNYKHDLGLCEKALKMDGRNFHCWDHRRIVAKLAQLPAEEELEFSNRLISDNFSNYSAWHYRATLLTRLQNEKMGDLKMEDKVVEEIKKVTNAFFTDPDDQSAWVYTRWLIGSGSKNEKFQYDSAHPSVPLTVTFHGKVSMVVMTKPCTVEVVMQYVHADDEAEWKGISRVSQSPNAARIWQFHSSTPLSVLSNGENGDKITIAEGRPWVDLPLLETYFGISVRSTNLVIDTILKNCKDLLELEPKNIWALYTITLCLIEIKPREAHEEIVQNLDKLATVLDPLRKNVYLEIRDRQIISSHLCKEVDSIPALVDLTMGDGRFSLEGLKIQSVDSLDVLAGLVYELHLSENNLESLDSLAVLPNLIHLNLYGNRITRLSCPSLSTLSSLSFLNVAYCPITDVADTVSAISQLPALTRFVFAETAISGKCGDIKNALGAREIRLIPYWL